MNKAKALTVGAQFKNSLQVLIEKMNQASPHFVRCIKPNHSKVTVTPGNGDITIQYAYVCLYWGFSTLYQH